MKSILISTILVLFSQLSFANTSDVEPIYSVTFLEVSSISMEPMCPINALCKRNGTIVHLGYELACDQKLFSFDYKVVPSGDITEIVVSAVATSRTYPGQPTCLALKFERKKLYLDNVYGEIVITNLGK